MQNADKITLRVLSIGHISSVGRRSENSSVFEMS